MQGGHLGGAASPSPYHYAPAAASVSVAHSSSSSGTGNNNRLSVSSHMVHNGGGGNNKLGVPISVVEDDGATSVVYKAIPANANAVSIAPDQTSTTFVSCSVATTQQQQQQQLQIQQQQQLAGASSPRAQSPSGGGGLASPSRLLHPTSSFRRGAGAGRGGPCRASSRRRRRGLHNPVRETIIISVWAWHVATILYSHSSESIRAPCETLCMALSRKNNCYAKLPQHRLLFPPFYRRSACWSWS